MAEDEELDKLWGYTPWELLKASIKVFLWDAWQFLKPRNLYPRLSPLSKVEIKGLREKAINQIKIKAAEQLGGKPNDYVVRDIKSSDIDEFPDSVTLKKGEEK